jgi:putative spermidine/putrescine transport system permease protein
MNVFGRALTISAVAEYGRQTSASATRRLLRTGLLSVLALWTLMPLLVLLVLSVSRHWYAPALVPSVWTMGQWRQLIAAASSQRSALLTSVALAALTALFSCVLALPLGQLIAQSGGWPRRFAAAMAFAPVAVPPIALATGLHFTLLTVGLAGHFGGVLVAHVIPAAGYLTLFFLGAFSAYDHRIEEEARTLGATRFAVWRRITLPMLRAPIADALALGFLISWAQVPLTLLIGGGLVRTLPIDVFAAIRAGDDARAASGSILLIVPALAAIAGVRLAVRRTGVVGL